MAERKNRRAETIEFETEENGFALEPAQVEIGSGYTVAVSYDENRKPVIDVKTYGIVDMLQLKRELGRTFPNAQIRQLRKSQTLIVTKRNKKRRKEP